MNLALVKEIKETKSIEEVNELLKNESWVLLNIIPNQQATFVLGRIEATCNSRFNYKKTAEELQLQRQSENEIRFSPEVIAILPSDIETFNSLKILSKTKGLNGSDLLFLSKALKRIDE